MNTALPALSDTVASPMLNSGSPGGGCTPSLSVMVPVALSLPSDIVAPLAPLSVTVNVSLCSTSMSSTTGTEIVFVRSPAANVSVPLVVV